ncbi:MAG: hypothetical protein GX130_04320 [Candidatus Hydrogenedens sp.]|jgi:CRISPR/Cas system CSM-associated protein Csm3 (group 7 of RAMP superfamily)|nr:hypothetical protein [Candidatus Hydrogenedens sp.]
MHEQLNSLRDAGGVRRISGRWVITAELELKTAAHFGGSTLSAVDMPILRDPKSQQPLLPGTSFTGALRSYLADYLSGYNSAKEPQEVALLFGGSRSDDHGDQSLVIVFDSIGTLPATRGVEIRDGVTIDGPSGTAAKHQKYDFEVLPIGTTFPFRMDLILESLEKEQDLLNLLRITLKGLFNGDLSIGLRKTRGLGVLKMKDHSCRVKRFDLSDQSSWLEWLCSDAEKPLERIANSFDDIDSALKSTWNSFEPAPFQDARSRLIAQIDLECTSGILVRAPGVTADTPDVSHLSSGGKSILPGTSLAGVLRNQAYRIAALVRQSQGDGDTWVESLFGPPADAGEKKITPSASPLRISESIISGGERMRPSRIRIDRFSQAVVKGALFDEEAHYNGRMRITFELRSSCKAQAGLLLLVLKDLILGDIPIGGAGSVGRGIVKGKGVLTLPDDQSFGLNANDNQSGLDDLIKAFHDAAVLTERRTLS